MKQLKTNRSHLLKPSQNFKRHRDNFFAVFNLIGKSFYLDPRGPLYLYAVPIFYTVLFYFAIGGGLDLSNEAKVSLLFTYMLLPGLTILTSLAPTIVGWKNSIFLRRIDSSGINKSMFLIALWVFFFLAGLSGTLVQFLVAMALGNKIFFQALPNIEWGYFFLGVIFTIILAIAMATFLGGIFSNQGLMMGIMMMIYFLSLFLSGMMLYPNLYEKSEPVRIITYLIPQKYATFLVLLAQDSRGLAGDFNNANPLHPDFTAVWQMVLGAILFIIAFFITTNFTFKWSAKK